MQSWNGWISKMRGDPMMADRFKALEQNLSRLKELTNAVDFKELVKEKHENEVVLQLEQGEARIVHIAKTPEYAICMGIIPPASIMGWHTHPETEILILLEGSLTIEYETGRRVTLEKFGVEVIPPIIAHRVIWEIASRNLALTIPACGEFPDGK